VGAHVRAAGVAVNSAPVGEEIVLNVHGRDDRTVGVHGVLDVIDRYCARAGPVPADDAVGVVLPVQAAAGAGVIRRGVFEQLSRGSPTSRI